MDEPLQYSLSEGIVRLTLNRPEHFNAFGLETIEPFTENLVALAKDPDVKGVVVTGAGKAFCAGGDLRWLSAYGKGPAEAFHTLAGRFHLAVTEIRRMPKPVVAALNGLAAGGGFSLALACDFRVMEASALLRQGYTTNGLSIDGGGTFTLPRLVGMARAMEIVAFDRPISSEQALSWGLVTEVVEDGLCVDRAVEMIREINRVPLSSFGAVKKLINDSFDTSFETALEREREGLAWCADHPNGREGVAAFLEKRKPDYR
jgi:2-(1,2-epoxy-1,2-dihydrophenyl)acetyl-CoA isomerase